MGGSDGGGGGSDGDKRAIAEDLIRLGENAARVVSGSGLNYTEVVALRAELEAADDAAYEHAAMAPVDETLGPGLRELHDDLVSEGDHDGAILVSQISRVSMSEVDDRSKELAMDIMTKLALLNSTAVEIHQVAGVVESLATLRAAFFGKGVVVGFSGEGLGGDGVSRFKGLLKR